MADFEITKGMLLEPLDIQLQYDDGTAVDLTSASSATFRMTPVSNLDLVEATGVMEFRSPATDGIVRYNWQSPDVVDAGYFLGQVFVTWQSGKMQAFPSNDNYFTIKITESLG